MNTLADGLFLLATAFGSLMLVGCGRAPSVDVFGAFFPAGLICFAVGILLAVICRALLQRRVEIALPILVYPSLTAIITFALWLALFR